MARITLSELLEVIPRDVEEQVLGARAKYLNATEEALERVTRLFLPTGRDAEDGGRVVSFEVKVESGAFPEYAELELDEEHRYLTLLLAYRNHLERLVESGGAVETLFAWIRNHQLHAPILRGRDASAASLVSLSKDLLDELRGIQRNVSDPLRRILSVEKDILGHYRFGSRGLLPGFAVPSTVVLYWSIIGMVALWMNIGVDELTVVVLAHELAHAFTHIGIDANNMHWKTSAFAQSEPALKEGLAQYYTDAVCKSLSDTRRRKKPTYSPVPGALKAYRELLARQPDIYQTHRRWDGRNREEIRRALLPIRQHEQVTLADFEAVLGTALP